MEATKRLSPPYLDSNATPGILIIYLNSFESTTVACKNYTEADKSWKTKAIYWGYLASAETSVTLQPMDNSRKTVDKAL